MNKIFTILILILGLTKVVFGQDVDTQKKLDEAKMVLINKELGMTKEQAAKFWPVYWEFAKKRQDLRQSFNEKRKAFDPKTATEADNQRIIEMGLKMKEQEFQLERDYSDRFLQVLSSRQLVSLKRAEEDFRRMILEQIEQNRQKQLQKQQNFQKIQENRGN